MIDEEIIEDYLELVDFGIIEKKYFDLVNINKNFDKTRFGNMENETGEIPIPERNEYYKWFWDNNRRKLIKE